MKLTKIFLITGATAFIDLDHIIPLKQKSLPITLLNLDTLSGRPLHIYFLYLSALIAVIFLLNYIIQKERGK